MNNEKSHITGLVSRYPALADCQLSIEKATKAVLDSYRNGGKLLLCGNGGSSSDCEHMAGELLKGFMKKREPSPEEYAALSSELGAECAAKLQRAIPAIPLPSLSGVLTAFINDVDPKLAYAQLVYGLGKPCDVLFAFSTSGNSENVVNAVKAARALGITTVAFTGASGGKLLGLADITVRAPETETYKIQEYHLPIYHAICAELEERLF